MDAIIPDAARWLWQPRRGNEDKLIPSAVRKLVVFCNARMMAFMAGAFHGVTEADAIINVGVSGRVVKTALEKVRGENFEVLWPDDQEDGIPDHVLDSCGTLRHQTSGRSVWHH